MLPNLRVAVAGVLASLLLIVTAFGLAATVRIAQRAKVGPIEPTNVLAYAGTEDWERARNTPHTVPADTWVREPDGIAVAALPERPTFTSSDPTPTATSEFKSEPTSEATSQPTSEPKPPSPPPRVSLFAQRRTAIATRVRSVILEPTYATAAPVDLSTNPLAPPEPHRDPITTASNPPVPGDEKAVETTQVSSNPDIEGRSSEPAPGPSAALQPSLEEPPEPSTTATETHAPLKTTNVRTKRKKLARHLEIGRAHV